MVPRISRAGTLCVVTLIISMSTAATATAAPITIDFDGLDGLASTYEEAGVTFSPFLTDGKLQPFELPNTPFTGLLSFKRQIANQVIGLTTKATFNNPASEISVLFSSINIPTVSVFLSAYDSQGMLVDKYFGEAGTPRDIATGGPRRLTVRGSAISRVEFGRRFGPLINPPPQVVALDLQFIPAIPEPTCLAMACLSLAMLTAGRRR